MERRGLSVRKKELHTGGMIVSHGFFHSAMRSSMKVDNKVRRQPLQLIINKLFTFYAELTALMSLNLERSNSEQFELKPICDLHSACSDQ